MPEARTRSGSRKRSVARGLDTGPGGTAVAAAKPPPAARQGLAPVSFPAEIRVPPHRGAVIVAAAVETTPARPGPAQQDPPAPKSTRRGAARPAAEAAPAKEARPKRRKTAKPAAPKSAQKSARKSSRPAATSPATGRTLAKPRAAPRKPRKAATAADLPPPAAAPMAAVHPATFPVLAALPLPVRDEALVVPMDPPAPAAPATRPAPPAAATNLPRSRALVRPQVGLVARVVAWLDRLIPRRRRAALPKARTRLERPVPPPMAKPVRSGSIEELPASPETASELARRMLLQLSDENERLRREIEHLRAAASQTQP